MSARELTLRVQAGAADFQHVRTAGTRLEILGLAYSSWVLDGIDVLRYRADGGIDRQPARAGLRLDGEFVAFGFELVGAFVVVDVIVAISDDLRLEGHLETTWRSRHAPRRAPDATALAHGGAGDETLRAADPGAAAVFVGADAAWRLGGAAGIALAADQVLGPIGSAAAIVANASAPTTVRAYAPLQLEPLA